MTGLTGEGQPLAHVWVTIDGREWCKRCLYLRKADPAKQKPCRVVEVTVR